MQAPRETDSEPRIGRFRLVRELGRGAMGVVYEAFQDDLQRRVALKVIAPDVLATDAAAGDRFEREARLAASIRHPGVVHVYEVGVAGGRAYLAMEFVEGQPLRPEHPTGGRADPHATAQIALEVARAVAALHQAGIVHRDIKPDNVLIDRDGRARVTDFGLALLRGDRADEHAGTPGFMAPEQLTRRFGEVSERSDVYGIGALLHALLTGRAPHERSVVADTVMATIEQDLPPAIRAPGVPAALSAVCRRCLERRPEQRYPTAAALADDLERWLRGDAPEATPPGRLRRAELFLRRRRMLAGHLVALLAFAALTTIDYTLTDTPTSYFLHALFVLALILVASLLLDWRNRRNPRERLTPYLWPIVDCAGLTWVLSDGDGLRSPLVMLYPLLVLVTGFWLDTRVILATTATAMTGYGWLIAQPRPWGALRVDLSQHLVVYTTLLVTGVILSLQVARARALRDYTTNRR